MSTSFNDYNRYPWHLPTPNTAVQHQARMTTRSTRNVSRSNVPNRMAEDWTRRLRPRQTETTTELPPSPLAKKRLGSIKESPPRTKTKRQQKANGKEIEKTRRGRVAKRKASTAKLAAGVNRKNTAALDQVPVASHQKSTRKGVKSNNALSNASLPEEDVVEPQEPVEPIVLPLTKKNLKLFEQSLQRANIF